MFCLELRIFYFPIYKMKKWFLYRVYKLRKGLFVFFILFLGGTFFTNLSGWQASPFFVWGMYSEKEDTSNYHPVLKITINDSSVINYSGGYTDANRFFLTSPLELYILMKKNNRKDPTEIFLKKKLDNNFSLIQNASTKVLNGAKEYNLFLPWYKKYLEQTTQIKIHTYKIELLKAGYTDSNKIEIYSSELIDTWKQ